MADGYSQVFDDSGFVVLCFHSWIIYFVVSIAIVLTLLSGLWLVREEKKEGE